MLSLEQLKLALKLPNISRAVIHQIVPAFKLAEHSIRVHALYKYLGGKDDEAALYHDLNEVFTGDIPSPAKKHLTGLDYFESQQPQFSDPVEKRLCKLCDKLCLVLQLKPYVNFSSEVLSIYQEELDTLMDISRELSKTREVKKLLKEITG